MSVELRRAPIEVCLNYFAHHLWIRVVLFSMYFVLMNKSTYALG